MLVQLLKNYQQVSKLLCFWLNIKAHSTNIRLCYHFPDIVPNNRETAANKIEQKSLLLGTTQQTNKQVKYKMSSGDKTVL